MSIDIQQTADADWIDLKTIRLQSLLDSPKAFGLTFEAASAYTDAQWKDRAGNRTPPMYFIARDQGSPVGLIGGVKASYNFELIAMWVAPSHRGIGVGRALVAKVLATAASRGESEVCLSVSPLNKAACALYEAMGFRFTQHCEALESYPEVIVQRMLAKLAPNPMANTGADQAVTPTSAMNIAVFPLIWRWTQPSHAVLPTNVLKELCPVSREHITALYDSKLKGSDLAIAQHRAATDPAETGRWLAGLRPPVGRVVAVWNMDTALSLPWETFIAYWSDFCYPSSDDVDIFLEDGPLVLRWRHDEIFEYVVDAL